MASVLIIGVSSGIGKALAEELDRKGYQLALTGRRVKLIQKNTSKFNKQPIIRFMDVSIVDESIETLNEIIQELGGLDILIFNSGVGMPNRSFEEEMNIVDVNVKGFTALTRKAYNYMRQEGHGHIVSVTSVAGSRGMRFSSAYSASKSYMSVYMEGLRHHSIKRKTGVLITEIRPGFVRTPMTEDKKGLFWVASPQKAARQIRKAVERKANIAYVSKRYFLVFWLIKFIPGWIYNRI